MTLSNYEMKWISDCGRYTVYLSDDCLNKFKKNGQDFIPNEIGSSLIGCYSTDGFEAFIAEISPIPSDSISSRYNFVRGIKGLKKYYRKLLKSNSGLYYIGEWHTHPFGQPIPSSTDDKNQFDISSSVKTNCPESILLIVAGNFVSKTEVGCYVYSRKRGRITLILEEP